MNMKKRRASKDLKMLDYRRYCLSQKSWPQRPTERGEGMAQELTGFERTHGAAAWIVVIKEDLSILA
ncbi:hypothetical protein E5676_scaffold384G001390 [Cucumis melo var. makuwa]|uniref:Uncharacterized protein n=1 Tax=Cucumis melo var. makuwa TaxID=1194695 RepID=A0A5A7VK80_CUCMM|nr:hypothetical protein E6C27_scaffold271G001460 [Cucumis melo var. makuwa]TYK27943.1 hypothetical protein E5676_scaffold384G001390 [Cucumis melo var. makuwa]